MSNAFKEKLELYRQGRLSSQEALAIEEEIGKYAAIKDYWDQQELELLEEIKQQMNMPAEVEGNLGRKIQSKLNKKMIVLSLITLCASILLLTVLGFTAFAQISKWTRVDSAPLQEERSYSAQLVHMISPTLNFTAGEMSTHFTDQSMTYFFREGISSNGQTPLHQLNITYKMGKLKSPEGTDQRWLRPLSSNLFYALASEPQMYPADWTYLENAPQGTKSQILVSFKSKLTPQEAVTMLGDSFLEEKSGFKVDMLADVGASIVLANSYNPALYVEQSKGISSGKTEELALIDKFNNYDDEIHKATLMLGLEQLKEHRGMTEYLLRYYSMESPDILSQADEMIAYVNDNGVQYVGALLSGDTKELLKLRDNDAIYACQVKEITVW